MRIYKLPLADLDDKRLNGQPRETRIMIRAIANMGGGYFRHPLTQSYINRVGELIAYDNDIQCERLKRHFKPMRPIDSDIQPTQYTFSQSDINNDYRDLMDRWENRDKPCRGGATGIFYCGLFFGKLDVTI